jgi:nitrous oxidase accessory protein NosD
MRALKVLLSVFVAGALVMAGSESAAAESVVCGATIGANTTLRVDLVDCPGDGLVIGADDVVVDLNGHTIDGVTTAGSAGIRLAGHRGVMVEHGTVQEFTNGVLLDDADSNGLRRVTVVRSGARGIQLQNGSDGNRLEFDTSSNNARSGFGLLASDRNLIAHATATGNPFSGLQGFTARENRVVDGTFLGNSAGIGLTDGSDGNVLARNFVSANTDVGIGIELGSENAIVENQVAGNRNAISFFGDRNRIVGNVVTARVVCEGDCGVGIDGSGGTGNLIAGNRVLGTRQEGIRMNEFEVAGGPPVIGNVFRGNVVRDAGTDGIAIQTLSDEISGHGTVRDNLVEGNVVIGSGRDGINVTRPANTVARNVALRNGRLGIEAVSGVIDGGFNIAHLNGDPRQCVNVFCR